MILAEDDDEMRTLLAWILREDGYDVIEADDGLKLVELLGLKDGTGNSPDVDLVVSDIRMPGATGLQVLDGLKELGWMVPFILITAFGHSHLHEEASRLGASAVFDKPFEIDEFRAEVQRILKLGDGFRP